MTPLEIVLSIVTGIASVCAILGFYLGFRKDKNKDIQDNTQFETSMLNNQRQMMNSIDELRLDVRESNKKAENTNERVIRLEEKFDSLDTRIKRIEEHQ